MNREQHRQNGSSDHEGIPCPWCGQCKKNLPAHMRGCDER